MGLLGALHYHIEERNEILTRMGFIEPKKEIPDSVDNRNDIPDVFRNAFDNENPDENPLENI